MGPHAVDSALNAPRADGKAIGAKDELPGSDGSRGPRVQGGSWTTLHAGADQQLASFSVPSRARWVISPFAGTVAAMKGQHVATWGSLRARRHRNRELPALTEERRKELIKLVHHRGEEGRVAVRNIRRHSKEELERLERDGGISEDDLVRSEKELQKLTDKHISDIDEVVAHKDAELKEI